MIPTISNKHLVALPVAETGHSATRISVSRHLGMADGWRVDIPRVACAKCVSTSSARQNDAISDYIGQTVLQGHDLARNRRFATVSCIARRLASAMPYSFASAQPSRKGQRARLLSLSPSLSLSLHSANRGSAKSGAFNVARSRRGDVIEALN